MTEELLIAVLKGGIFGVAAAFFGWAKQKRMQRFFWKGLALKLPIGFCVGAFAGWQGIPISEAHEYLVAVGAVEVSDIMLKALLRRLFGWNLELIPSTMDFTSQEVHAILRCAEGAGTVNDVIVGTEGVRSVLTNTLDLSNPRDKEFYQHASFVWNQILQIARKRGLTLEAREQCGKLLYRLFIVWRHYQTENESCMADWVHLLDQIVADLPKP